MGKLGLEFGITAQDMDATELRLLQRVIFREQALEEVGRLTRELGGQRVLVVSDPGVIGAGHLDKALSYLRDAGLRPFLFDRVEENPTTRHVDTGVSFARENQPVDFIVAVGGGSVMDCAKGINFILTNGGKMEDYWGVNKARHPMLRSIGIPTTAGTGSEAQSFAIISQEETHHKMACGDRKVLFNGVILDPVVTLSMSKQLTAITAMDAISHALESYVCTRRNPVSAMLGREAWQLLYGNSSLVLKDSGNLEARTQMLWGAHFAGAAIENSMLGAAHACANPLTALFGIVHGVAVSLMLPHVIRFNEPAVDGWYGDLLEAAGSLNQAGAADLVSQLFEETRQACGLPQNLRDCRVDEASLPELARLAADQWTGKFNPRPATQRDYLSLYEQAY